MGFKSDIQATNIALASTGRTAGEIATTLDGSVTATATSIVLANITGFATTLEGGGVIVVGTEVIKYTTLTGGTKTISGLTRGYLNTVAIAHNTGVGVIFFNIVIDGVAVRLRAISISSDGVGAGKLTIASVYGENNLTIDLPSGAVLTLNIPEDGIVCPTGIYVGNALNINAVTFFTDKFSGPNLTTTNG